MVFPTPLVPLAIAIFTIVVLRLYLSNRGRTSVCEDSFSPHILLFNPRILAEAQKKAFFVRICSEWVLSTYESGFT
jgi:hypothetical protein